MGLPLRGPCATLLNLRVSLAGPSPKGNPTNSSQSQWTQNKVPSCGGGWGPGRGNVDIAPEFPISDQPESQMGQAQEATCLSCNQQS
jgi:hypothetical protein